MNHHSEHQTLPEHPPLEGTFFDHVRAVEALLEEANQTARTWPAIAGLDLSMTATGLAVHVPVLADDRDGFDAVRLSRIDSKPMPSGPMLKGKRSVTWHDRHVRMGLIVHEIMEAIPYGSLVFVEAPSYGSTGSGTFDRSGLWWMVYDSLVEAAECRVVPVSPSQRMLYATGKGGGKDAGKDAVIAAVTRRYPGLDVRDNNVADAVVLMAMARRAAGVPMEDTIPAANLKAIDKLEVL